MSLVFAWMGTDDDGNDDDLDDDDDPLNSEDDDEEDSEEALNTENLVLCQYDKVTRTKNKWKAQLKFGVSHHPLYTHIHPPFLFPYVIIFLSDPLSLALAILTIFGSLCLLSDLCTSKISLHKCLQIFLNLYETKDVAHQNRRNS